MKDEERKKMFKDVFAPKSGEKILFLIDIPHKNIKDTDVWRARRAMAQDWYRAFKELGKEIGFSVNLLEYNATGMNSSPLPQTLVDELRVNHLVIAMTEYSATPTLVHISKKEGSITRCASMPGVEKRMEETAFKADYREVRRYANAIEHMLNNAVGASIVFSTGDNLYIDLRNPSKTEGIMPVSYDNELLKFIIRNNQIIKVIGEDEKAEEMRIFFLEEETRRNIAELGIGCNPNAVVTGNVLEDEKVGGLHIAYGMSVHLGGKVKSDMHQDICYPKGLPVESTTLNLINKNGSKTELIHKAMLRYELLK